MLGIHFTEHIPQSYRDWRKTNSDLFRRFAWELIDRGVMLEPDSREPWFLCEAHQKMDLGWLEDIAYQSISAALDAEARDKA
jgi:glutamate-1-semialdehyde 2,1-aminomutase